MLDEETRLGVENDSICIVLIPSHAICKLCPVSTKYIQRTADRQVDFSITASVDQVQVFHRPRPAGIGHRYRAPLGQFRDQVSVDPLLQTFVIRRVDQKLRAIRFQHADVVFLHVSRRNIKTLNRHAPLVISISVRVCHLFMATNQVSPFRRQLRSMTSLAVSSPNDASTDWSLCREKRPEGKRNEVIMTYCFRILRKKPRNPRLHRKS